MRALWLRALHGVLGRSVETQIRRRELSGDGTDDDCLALARLEVREGGRCAPHAAGEVGVHHCRTDLLYIGNVCKLDVHRLTDTVHHEINTAIEFDSLSHQRSGTSALVMLISAPHVDVLAIGILCGIGSDTCSICGTCGTVNRGKEAGRHHWTCTRPPPPEDDRLGELRERSWNEINQSYANKSVLRRRLKLGVLPRELRANTARGTNDDDAQRLRSALACANVKDASSGESVYRP